MSWSSDNGIALDHDGDVPLGVQLDWAIRAAVASGRLRPGERLPALRDLAGEIRVNHNTVRAAVARLERDGVLESRHGSGTFVAARAHEKSHAPLVDEVVRLAADAGISPRELATALYVADEPPEGDAAAHERRALRDEIAVLDRLLVDLEAKLPRHVPTERGRATGGRILTTEQLRAERDAVVRRIAAVQRVLDGDEDDTTPKREKAPQTTVSGARRRAPRPGIAPA